MRRSETIAFAFCIGAMGAAALVFPAIGLWAVIKRWHEMDPFEQGLLCTAAVLNICAMIAMVHHLRQARSALGEAALLSLTMNIRPNMLFDLIVLAVAFFLGDRALTHEWHPTYLTSLVTLWGWSCVWQWRNRKP